MPEHSALQAAFYLAHELGAWALAALVAGHAAVALVHHFVLRDDVLECMAPVIITTRCTEEASRGELIKAFAGLEI